VAIKLPSESDEVCLVEPARLRDFTEKNKIAIASDYDLLTSATDQLILNEFKEPTKVMLKKLGLCKPANIKKADPTLIQIATILSTSGAYLVDRDCRLNILLDSRQRSSSWWSLFTPNSNILYPDIPIMANAEGNNTSSEELEEAILIKETKIWTFQPKPMPSSDFLEKKLYPLLKAKLDSRAGDTTIPITISCDFISVGDDRARVTSRPFEAEVTEYTPK